MKLNDLIEKLLCIKSENPNSLDLEVVVKITLPYTTTGPTPTVQLNSLQVGFDWDNGKLLLSPSENITFSNRDFTNEMTEIQKRAGRIDLENRRLKTEILMLQKRVGLPKI